jgi:hypothetical protein
MTHALRMLHIRTPRNHDWHRNTYNNNNNNNIYLLQMDCHPVAVITLHLFPNTANNFT